MTDFDKLCKELEAEIVKSYTEGVTLVEAEKLAGQFLHAQLRVSEELKTADLSSRMRKTGVKSIRAIIYTKTASAGEKRPTEAALEAAVNMNDLVLNEQEQLDKSEVDKDNLTRYYNIFREAHLHFRAITKGSFQ